MAGFGPASEAEQRRDAAIANGHANGHANAGGTRNARQPPSNNTSGNPNYQHNGHGNSGGDATAYRRPGADGGNHSHSQETAGPGSARSPIPLTHTRAEQETHRIVYTESGNPVVLPPPPPPATLIGGSASSSGVYDDLLSLPHAHGHGHGHGHGNGHPHAGSRTAQSRANQAPSPGAASPGGRGMAGPPPPPPPPPPTAVISTPAVQPLLHPEDVGKDMQHMRCHSCNVVGHLMRYCPRVTCFHCHTPGHMASVCPTGIGKKAAGGAAAPAQDGLKPLAQ